MIDYGKGLPDEDEWKGLYVNSAAKNSCFTKGDTRLFVQYTCEQSAENQSMKYNQMCLISGTAILIALLFTVTMRYLFQGGKITKIDWDMATVTAGDYSVEIDIYKENYDEWMKNSYEAADGILENNPDKSPALALKETLIEQICQNMNAYVDSLTPAQLQKSKTKKKKDLENGVPSECKIADVVFSFDNRELILAMRERGGAIAAQDFDKVAACDKKVQALFDDFDKVTVPTSAFVTFESDDYKEHALNYEGDAKVLGSQAMFFRDASEPTDIIWENRHFSRRDYFKRQLIAFLVVGLILFLSFLTIFFISTYSAKVAAVFPPQDCENFDGLYSAEDYPRYAVDDYEYITEKPDAGRISDGTLQCFCQKE